MDGYIFKSFLFCQFSNNFQQFWPFWGPGKKSVTDDDDLKKDPGPLLEGQSIVIRGQKTMPRLKSLLTSTSVQFLTSSQDVYFGYIFRMDILSATGKCVVILMIYLLYWIYFMNSMCVALSRFYHVLNSCLTRF